MTPPERIPLGALLGDTSIARRIADILARGDLIVYPTETIYGIGGNGCDSAAEQRIIRAKRRVPDNPMLLLAGSREAFTPFGLHWHALAEKLAKSFWPGNLTLVLPRGGEWLGIRVSDHPFMRSVNPFFDKPLFSTSANISGEPYRNDPDEIYRMFEQDIAAMIDGGTLPDSPPSTVVRVSRGGACDVLREGVIPASAVREAVSGKL